MMNAREELIQRLAERRAEQLGTLSAGAYDELMIAVRAQPERFVEGSVEQAFYLMVQALERNEQAQSEEELLDDDEYPDARAARLRRLHADCQAALAVDVRCLDAALLAVLAADAEPAVTLEALLELERHEHAENGPLSGAEQAGDSWTYLHHKARLRLQAAIARTYLETGRYRAAVHAAETAVTAVPHDPLGCRNTSALALARLEDEAGFDALDTRFGRCGNAWLHLGRCILLYKLGRQAAARRALSGYAQLCEGGAYALLRPVALDIYLPDRPEAAADSYTAAACAVWEAEGIILDVPGFVAWAFEQPGFAESAARFASANGFEW